jgi:hypothetical protein
MAAASITAEFRQLHSHLDASVHRDQPFGPLHAEDRACEAADDRGDGVLPGRQGRAASRPS